MDLSANLLSGELPSEPPKLPFLLEFDASSNNLGGSLPTWISKVTFGIYLVDNFFLCPYPPLPRNVVVDEHCASNIWFQGVFFAVVCVLELFCFIASSVCIALAVTFLHRPALIARMVQYGKDGMDVDKLHRRSRYLGKAQMGVLAFSIAESFIILVRILIFG
jgi:hypothetical protein